MKQKPKNKYEAYLTKHYQFQMMSRDCTPPFFFKLKRKVNWALKTSNEECNFRPQLTISSSMAAVHRGPRVTRVTTLDMHLGQILVTNFSTHQDLMMAEDSESRNR